jgi:hypothetical protein
MLLSQILTALSVERAATPAIVVSRFGGLLAQVQDALLVLASQGYVEKAKAPLTGCRSCPRNGHCAGQLWRLTHKGERAKEAIEREKAVGTSPW